MAENPNNPQVLTRAGDCCFHIGDLSKAEALFQRALALGQDTLALLGLARLQRHRGEFDFAPQSYQRLLSRKPGDTRAIVLLGETLGEVKGHAVAREYLEAQRKAHPETKEIECAIQRWTDCP